MAFHLRNRFLGGRFGPKEHKKRWYLRIPRDTLEDMVYEDRQKLEEAERKDAIAEEQRQQKQTSDTRPATQPPRQRTQGGDPSIKNKGRPHLPPKGSPSAKRMIEAVKLLFVRSFDTRRKRRNGPRDPSDYRSFPVVLDACAGPTGSAL